MEKGKGDHSVHMKINKRLKNIICMLSFFPPPLNSFGWNHCHVQRLAEPQEYRGNNPAQHVDGLHPLLKSARHQKSTADDGIWVLLLPSHEWPHPSKSLLRDLWKARHLPNPTPLPENHSYWPFPFPHTVPHAPRRLSKACTRLNRDTAHAFSCINISKPWSRAFNIWTKHCAVKAGRKQLTLSLMGFQSNDGIPARPGCGLTGATLEMVQLS